MIRLTILAAAQILAFVGALLAFLQRIVTTLSAIGGSPTSYLAKINFGVSAIEKETSHLVPQMMRLNQDLTTLGAKLGVVDGHLQSVAEALGGDEPR